MKRFLADFHPFFMSHVQQEILFIRRTSKISSLSWVFKGALLDILKTEASYIDNDKIMARL